MADIKLIAEKLVRLSDAQTYALACFLAKEYGIKAEDVTLKKELPAETVKIFEVASRMSEVLSETVTVVKSEQINAGKKRWYVPRKIGKPCKVLPQKRK